MASVNGKRTEGSIKELIDSQNPNPLGIVETCRFDLPPGEGAPQGLRGWGVRLRGSGEEFPSGFGQRPRSMVFSNGWSAANVNWLHFIKASSTIVERFLRGFGGYPNTWNFACKV